MLALLPMSFQLGNVFGTSVFYRGLYVLIFLLDLLKNLKEPRFTKKRFIFLFAIACVYIFIPIFSMRVEFESLIFGVFTIIFACDILICVDICKRSGDEMMRCFLLSNSIVLLFQILINISQINQFTIMRMFDSSIEIRAYFGFRHPNFAAMFLVSEIVLLYICLGKTNRKAWRGFYCITIAACFIPILATGSRTALIAVLFFLVSELIFKSEKILKGYTKYVYVLLLVVGCTLVITLCGDYIVNNSSGRLNMFAKNFSLLNSASKILFGLGGGSTSSISSIKGIRFSDNWFVTCIVRYGVLGLLFMTVLLFMIIRSLFKNPYADKYAISLLFTLIIYSMGENMLFTAGVSLSFLLWVIVGTALTREKPNKRFKRHRVRRRRRRKRV